MVCATHPVAVALTVLHKLGHSNNHNHREQAHQNHRVLENAHHTEPASDLVEILLRRRPHFNLQFALRRAQMRTFVAPFIAPESLPDVDDLLRSIALGASDVHAVR